MRTRDAVLAALVGARPHDEPDVLIERANEIAHLACERWGHTFAPRDERTGYRECERCGYDLPPPAPADGGPF